MTTTISPEDFEKAVRRACVRAVTRAMASEPLRAGDRTAVLHGAVLKDIADEADLSVPQARRQMRALQDAGKVIRDDRRGGSTAWWLIGLAAELKAPEPARATAEPLALARHPECHEKSSSFADTVEAARQALTPKRDNWWEVLGVAQDDSFRECTRCYLAELTRLNDLLVIHGDPEAASLIDRLQAAYDGAAKAHEVQVTE